MEFLTDLNPIAFVAVVVVATMLFLPGSVTMTLAGFLYGLGPGLLLAAVAVPLGAQAAFSVGRWIARPWVLKKARGNSRVKALDAGLKEQAFTIIALSRMSLVVPFNVFNYVCGASAVRPTTYFLATSLGMLPAIGLYVYLGTLAQDIRDVLSGESTPSELSWWLMGVGAVLLIILVAIVRQAAERALTRHLKSEERDSSDA